MTTEFIEGITSSGLDRKPMILSLFANDYFKTIPRNIKFKQRISGFILMMNTERFAHGKELIKS